jgi:hypothetical protein
LKAFTTFLEFVHCLSWYHQRLLALLKLPFCKLTSHPLLTTYQSTAKTSRDIYDIPHSPNSLNSQVHKVCLTVKSCVYSTIFLARSQPGFSPVYSKSIQKNPNLHKIIWMYDGPHRLCLKIDTKIH